MREIADHVYHEPFRPAYNPLFQQLQRGGVLERYRFLDGHYLVSAGGIGHFASSKISCAECYSKEHRNGETGYYHQLLAAVIVHPGHSNVFPFAPEAIIKEDGKTKNDCERNAAKRLLSRIRKTHPKLPLIVVQDGLSANGPGSLGTSVEKIYNNYMRLTYIENIIETKNEKLKQAMELLLDLPNIQVQDAFEDRQGHYSVTAVSTEQGTHCYKCRPRFLRPKSCLFSDTLIA